MIRWQLVSDNICTIVCGVRALSCDNGHPSISISARQLGLKMYVFILMFIAPYISNSNICIYFTWLVIFKSIIILAKSRFLIFL